MIVIFYIVIPWFWTTGHQPLLRPLLNRKRKFGYNVKNEKENNGIYYDYEIRNGAISKTV